MNTINLKKEYGRRYRVTMDGDYDKTEEGRLWCQEIVGKYGKIYPYGENMLALSMDSTTMSKRVLALGDSVKIKAGVICAHSEFVLTFSPHQIHDVAKLIRARKKRSLSDKNRKEAIERLKKFMAINARPSGPSRKGP